MSKVTHLVYGRVTKRGGTRGQRRWIVTAGATSDQQAHFTAMRMVAIDRIGWNYTIVKPVGEKPRLRDQEDYCRYTD